MEPAKHALKEAQFQTPAKIEAGSLSPIENWQSSWPDSNPAQVAIVGSGKLTDDFNLVSTKTSLLISGALGLFSVLMIYGSIHHQLVFDEAQAWVIARDSHGLIDLFRHLHYEGHPALWYLLLYLPAHLSGNVAWIKGIHCALSVAMGSLITLDKRVPPAIRILIIFSAYIMFFIGVFDRSYVLAAVLLIAAVRCLLAAPKYHWFGIAALGLAINTHFLAIPLAFGILLWTYVTGPNAGLHKTKALLETRRFWVSVGTLLLALFTCYLAVKPPNDVLPKAGISPLRDLVLGMGHEIWHFFVPFSWLLPAVADKLWVCVLLIGLGLLGVIALPTRRARLFMVCVTLAWGVVEWITAHSPSFQHASFVFISFVIALLLVDAREWTDFRDSMPSREQLLHILLGVQVLIGFMWLTLDMRNPTSAGKLTADWLTKSGHSGRHLVIEPDLIGPAILANAGISSAYYPACRCEGSFVVFRERRDALRGVTRDEIETLRSRYSSYPIIIVSQFFPDQERKSLKWKLLYTSPRGWLSAAEDTFVYSTDPDEMP